MHKSPAQGSKKRNKIIFHEEGRMPTQEKLKELPIDEAESHEFSLNGRSITLHIAPLGYVIDTNSHYTPNRSNGKFRAVLELGTVLKDRGMSGSVVSLEKRWSPDNHPENVVIAEFDSDYGRQVAAAADKIEEIVNTNGPVGFLDPAPVLDYFAQDTIIASHQLPQNGLNGYAPVAVVRAGVTALEAAGVRVGDQILVSEKRLNKKDDPDVLAIGMDFAEEDLARIAGRPVYIRERAIASGTTLIALYSVLAACKALPKTSVLAATVGAQAGLELDNLFAGSMKEMYGLETTFNVGRVSSRLTGPPHPFYVASENGRFSVGDGGDWGDMLLPARLRRLFPEFITPSHVEELKRLHLSFEREVLVGQPINHELILYLRNKAVGLGHRRFAVGKILSGVREEVVLPEGTPLLAEHGSLFNPIRTQLQVMVGESAGEYVPVYVKRESGEYSKQPQYLKGRMPYD